MKLFTIGFTKKSAEEFFDLLKKAGVHRVVDIRLNNTSQIAGFAKARDLEYFLRAINGIDYLHLPEFAPTQEILDNLKKKKGSWIEFESNFKDLIIDRRIDETANDVLCEKDCLLCSEPTAEHCHRRLVAEYFQDRLGNIEVIHL